MANKKDEKDAQAAVDAVFRPDHAYHVGVPDVVSDAELENMKREPRYPAIAEIAEARNAEWKKAQGKTPQPDVSQVEATEAAAAAEAPEGESEVSNG